VVRYIHLNPVRAHMVSAPEDYPYSGHLGYLGRHAFPFLSPRTLRGELLCVGGIDNKADVLVFSPT